MNLFLSPHDDDNVLFGAFTCMREKPCVAIVADSYRQPMRGEIGCDAITRAEETLRACSILGCGVVRFGIGDNYDDETFEACVRRSLVNFQGFEKIYAPAILENGNAQHNIVGKVAGETFGNRVVYYMTYTRDNLYIKANTEIIPTLDELRIKENALSCFQSQIKLNATRPHFDAVRGKSEWIL